MYLLYLDDSGSPNNVNENYFVLGGICVPETSVRWLSHQLDELAEKIDPNSPEKVEFHAAEIFRGKKVPWNQYREKESRISIIKDVLGTIKQSYQDTVIYACAIHKASFPTENPVLLAYEDLASRFNIYIQTVNESSEYKHKGLIILDRSSYETGLQALALTIRRTGTRWGRQLRYIAEVPLFVDSPASRLTQLADHIAYAVFRRYESGDLNYFNSIEDRFFVRDNIVHGLSHKQLIIPKCTCPACISRRSS